MSWVKSRNKKPTKVGLCLYAFEAGSPQIFFLTAITGSETKYQFSTAGSHQSDEATPALEIFGGEVAGADSATLPSAPRRIKGWKAYFGKNKFIVRDWNKKNLNQFDL